MTIYSYLTQYIKNKVGRSNVDQYRRMTRLNFVKNVFGIMQNYSLGGLCSYRDEPLTFYFWIENESLHFHYEAEEGLMTEFEIEFLKQTLLFDFYCTESDEELLFLQYGSDKMSQNLDAIEHHLIHNKEPLDIQKIMNKENEPVALPIRDKKIEIHQREIKYQKRKSKEIDEFFVPFLKDESNAKNYDFGFNIKTNYYGTTLTPIYRKIKKNGDYTVPYNVTKKSFHDVNIPKELKTFTELFCSLTKNSWEFDKEYGRLRNIFGVEIYNFLRHCPAELFFVEEEGKRYEVATFLYDQIHFKFVEHNSNIQSIRIDLELFDSETNNSILYSNPNKVVNNHKLPLYIIQNEDQFFCPIPKENYKDLELIFAIHNEFGIFRKNQFHAVLTNLKTLDFPHLSFAEQIEPITEIQLDPIPVLHFSYEEDYEMYSLFVIFNYVKAMKESKKATDIINPIFLQNLEYEKQCVQYLNREDVFMQKKSEYEKYSDINQSYFFTGVIKKDDFVPWLTADGKKLFDAGFVFYNEDLETIVSPKATSIRLQTSKKQNWLEFKPELIVDDEAIPISKVDFETGVAYDKNNNVFFSNPEDLARLIKMMKYAQLKGGSFRVPSENFVLINEIYDERENQLPEVKDAIEKTQKLASFKKIPTYRLSSKFKGQLRKYQTAGFNWLMFLNEFHFNGVLADDMGLGKTVQTLALLQTLKGKKKLSTSLLVLPVSAVSNWEDEIGKFTSTLTYHRFMGSKRTLEDEHFEQFDLILTSYATLRNSVELLKKYKWGYIILDEAQNIKNSTALTTKAVKVLKAENRLALSGTPIENNIMELWSIFDFLMPSYLGGTTWFKSQYGKEIETERSADKADILKKMLYPFILRRKKEDVALDLPEKNEIVVRVEMEKKQADLYNKTAKYYAEEVAKELDEKGVGKSSMKVLEGMLRLRQICLFPELYKKEFKPIPSAKLDAFKESLDDILKEDHKVLVFSQFVKGLDIIHKYLKDQKIKHHYLSGKTTLTKRKKMIKDFQEKNENKVFLLSLKAGGTAINLTAADYVVIFDPWWNPAVESQAIDRSYRIGQTRKVIAYKYVVKDSIEEKILKLQEHKKELVDMLITEDKAMFKDLSKNDILSLFK